MNDHDPPKKETKTSTILARIKAAHPEFTILEITLNDIVLRKAANVILGRLREDGDVDRKRGQQSALWYKTSLFGTSKLWSEGPVKHRPASEERKLLLSTIAKLPHKRNAVKVPAALELVKAAPSKFSVKDLHAQNTDISVNTIREVLRLLSKEREALSGGVHPGSEWTKTGEFGKSILWKLLTDPGEVKFGELRKEIDGQET